MRVIVKGDKKTIEYDLLDHYDEKTRISSMARTTGYTCTAVVDLLVKGMFRETGVFPPEMIGKEKPCFDHVLAYLKERGVNWVKREK